MNITNINNGDSGLSVRNKLNQLIAMFNGFDNTPAITVNGTPTGSPMVGQIVWGAGSYGTPLASLNSFYLGSGDTTDLDNWSYGNRILFESPVAGRPNELNFANSQTTLTNRHGSKVAYAAYSADGAYAQMSAYDGSLGAQIIINAQGQIDLVLDDVTSPGLTPNRDLSGNYQNYSYVQKTFTDNTYLKKAGDSMTGTLNGVTPAELSYLMGATSNLQNQINNLVSGLSWKAAVRAATTANITLSGAQTVDGVVLVAGDRVLVKNQTTASQNGIYVVAAGSWTRSTDASTGTTLLQATVSVEEGTVNADTIYTCTTDAPITAGTSSLAFGKMSGTTYTPGTNLTLTGNTFDLANTLTGITGGVAMGSGSASLDTNRILDLFKSQNSATYGRVINQSTGTAGIAGMNFQNSATSAWIQKLSSGFTTNGVYTPGSFIISNTGDIGLDVSTGQSINFAVNDVIVGSVNASLFKYGSTRMNGTQFSANVDITTGYNGTPGYVNARAQANLDKMFTGESSGVTTGFIGLEFRGYHATSGSRPLYQFRSYDQTASGNYTGTSVPLALSFLNTYAQSGYGSPLAGDGYAAHLAGTYVWMVGTTNTNKAVRMDVTGMRIGTMADVHTANTYAFEVGGAVKVSSLITPGDIEITTAASGLILKDRGDGTRRRILVTNGVLSTEAA